MKRCKRCGYEFKLTEHHNYPICHFGRKDNDDKTIRCEKCHHKVESYILAVESFITGKPYGRRYALHTDDYKRIKEILNL